MHSVHIYIVTLEYWIIGIYEKTPTKHKKSNYLKGHKFYTYNLEILFFISKLL